MEKKNMKREWISEIPILKWKGIPLIQIGEETFVTAEPIGKGIRTLEIGKRMARQFAERYNCRAKVTDDEEWKKVINYLKVNFAITCFIENNKLYCSEALLLDSMRGPQYHILSGGQFHRVDEMFHGFISDYDADGEEQPEKLVFFTIKPNSNLI